MLIHLGSNNLGLLKEKALIIQVKEDLKAISLHWLSVKLIWSAIIPWQSWHWTKDPTVIERTWCKANKELHRLGALFATSHVSC